MSENSTNPLDSLPALDLSAPVVYLPIRHHSPACALHVGRIIRDLRPSEVLIEGPRDASEMIPLLARPETRAPVALFTLFVDRDHEPPSRHTAYYPLCDYSPELEAIRAAAAIGAEARFIDLTWPEMVRAERAGTADDHSPRSLQDDDSLRRGRWLQLACEQEGARDSDDLWDVWFEIGARERDSATFFREVLAWCAACRAEIPGAELAADGCLAREAAMRAEIDHAVARSGRVVVVTGGIHTLALPTTRAASAPAVVARDEDQGRWLIRYDFLQLDRLNGYSSGMPSPEFHQRRWDNTPAELLLVELARQLRKLGPAASTADVVGATAHLRRLARFRGHARPSREDLLDAARSAFIKGATDTEGVVVLGAARKLLAGDRRGEVPTEAGQPPIVRDFETQAALHRLKLDSTSHEIELDIYRSLKHRQASRFFHSLTLLGVEFANSRAGPDFVRAQSLQRVREVWRYSWSPSVEARLVECSARGQTIREAALNTLVARIAEAQTAPRRAEASARLVVEACRCGLHDHAARLLPEATQLALTDADPISVIHACEHLAMLQQASEPLEAHTLPRLDACIDAVWRRSSFIISSLAAVDPADADAENESLRALLAWASIATQLSDPLSLTLRDERLRELADSSAPNAAVLGAAAGLLYDQGALRGDDIGTRLAGMLTASHQDATLGARFLRGLLTAARAACWIEPAIVRAINDALGTLDEPAFTLSLPHLRLAFAELSPRATDEVAAAAAGMLGLSSIPSVRANSVSQQTLSHGLRADAALLKSLERDGLLELIEGGAHA